MIPRHFETGPDHLMATNTFRNGTCSGSNFVVTTTTSQGVSKYGWSYANGYRIPNFEKRKAAGELLPMLPWTRVQCRGEIEPGVEKLIQEKNCNGSSPSCSLSFTWDHTLAGNGTFNPSAGAWPAWGIQPHEGYDALDSTGDDPHFYVQQAAAAIYTNGWDALTFTSEFHKTARMFVNAKRRFAKLVEDAIFRRKLPRKPKSVSEALSIASRDWLEYRYGWRILVMDLEEIAKMVKSLDEKRTRWSERRGLTHSIVVPSTFNYQVLGYNCVRHDLTEWKIGVRGSVTADAKLASARFNLAVTGWELVPFSFVLDWFVYVNQALEALSFYAVTSNYVAATGVEIMGFRSIGDSYTTTRNSQCPGVSITYTPPTWKRKSTLHIRQRSPASVNTRPQTRIRLNLAKGMDIFSLIKLIVVDGKPPRNTRYG